MADRTEERVRAPRPLVGRSAPTATSVNITIGGETKYLSHSEFLSAVSKFSLDCGVEIKVERTNANGHGWAFAPECLAEGGVDSMRRYIEGVDRCGDELDHPGQVAINRKPLVLQEIAKQLKSTPDTSECHAIAAAAGKDRHEHSMEKIGTSDIIVGGKKRNKARDIAGKLAHIAGYNSRKGKGNHKHRLAELNALRYFGGRSNDDGRFDSPTHPMPLRLEYLNGVPVPDCIEY